MSSKLSLLVLLGIFLSMNIFGQAEEEFKGDKESLDYLLYLFQTDKDKGIEHNYRKSMYRNRVPNDLAEEYLDRELKGSEEGFFTDSVAFYTDSFHALVYTIPHADEERYRESYLTTITQSGKHVSTILFDHYKRTNLTLDTAQSTIVLERLLERAETKIRYDPENVIGKKVDTQFTNYYHYEILKSGKFKKLKSFSATGYREFPFTSKRLVRGATLADATSRELQMMRNEIYADYGYKFPVDRWKEYFSEKGWYEPKYDRVFDKMNLVEQMNVKRIVKFERKKR